MKDSTRITLTISLAAIIGLALMCTGVGITRAITAHADRQQSALCPTHLVETQTPGVLAVVQAALVADKDYALYSFNGVSEIPRRVGTLGQGEQFCFREGHLDWNFEIETEEGTEASIGWIDTKNWDKGVYSDVTASIRAVPRDDGDHRAILVQSATGLQVDRENSLRFFAPPLMGKESPDMDPLTKREVSALRR